MTWVPGPSGASVNDVVLTVDGQEGMKLANDDVVEVRPSKNRVLLVRSPTHSFFELLKCQLVL